MFINYLLITSITFIVTYHLIVLDRFLGDGTDLDEIAPSQWKIASVQATGGIVAGATASCITTPLDTIKTRLQVLLGPS